MENDGMPTAEELLEDSGAPTGLCDSGCGAHATTWFGRTAVATCGSVDCVAIQEEEYCKL